jgi:class 3 adenylate cyclase
LTPTIAWSRPTPDPKSTATGRGQIVVGPRTYEAVKDHFHCEPQPPVALKGKAQSIQTYIVGART